MNRQFRETASSRAYPHATSPVAHRLDADTGAHCLFVEEVQATVWVRRHWNDSLGARYRLDDIKDWHWREQSGGAMVRSPRPFLYGYAMCDAMLEGHLSHSCRHGPAPHRVLVCMVQKDNSKEIVAEVNRRALPVAVSPLRPWR